MPNSAEAAAARPLLLIVLRPQSKERVMDQARHDRGEGAIWITTNNRFLDATTARGARRWGRRVLLVIGSMAVAGFGWHRPELENDE